MRPATCLLASLLSFGALAAEPTPADWYTIGQGPKAQYDVLRASVEADVSTFSVQFMLRTTYKDPVKNQNGTVSAKTFVEHTLVLCNEDLMVTMNQLAYNEKGEHISTMARATVYQNPGWRGQIITETIRWACSGFSRKAPTPAEPAVTPSPGRSTGFSV